MPDILVIRPKKMFAIVVLLIGAVYPWLNRARFHWWVLAISPLLLAAVAHHILRNLELDDERLKITGLTSYSIYWNDISCITLEKRYRRYVFGGRIYPAVVFYGHNGAEIQALPCGDFGKQMHDFLSFVRTHEAHISFGETVEAYYHNPTQKPQVANSPSKGIRPH